MDNQISQQANTVIAQSMGADITGRGVDMRGARGFFMDAAWSGGGSPVGVLILQTAMVDVDAEYKDFRSFTVNVDGSVTYDCTRFNGVYVRAFYDRTSGTGTMSVALNRKA